MHSSSLTERLRELVRGAGPLSQDAAHVRRVVRRDAGRTARQLGGLVLGPADGACIVVEREYPASTRHGRALMRDWAEAASDAAANLALTAPAVRTAGPLPSQPGLLATESGLAEQGATRPLLFVDLETTGLAGGAGTHAFLVGCGWFHGDGFRTRQLFLTGLELERAFLRHAADALEAAGALVSFNGKTFDVPLIETRYLFHRMAPPLVGTRHYDMLYPARRLWRQESCALTTLERDLFGVRRHDDVQGHEIPGRYFRYVRTGDGASLVPVFEHNRLDLLSLAGLAVRAAHILAAGAESTRDARESVGLGRLYDRAGLAERAAACYERGANLAGSRDEDVRLEALRRLALLHRRARRHQEAAAAWERLLASAAASSAPGREAIHALAVYHEHRSGDLSRARQFTLRALDLERAAERLEAMRYRLARLDRKLGNGSNERLIRW